MVTLSDCHCTCEMFGRWSHIKMCSLLISLLPDDDGWFLYSQR